MPDHAPWNTCSLLLLCDKLILSCKTQLEGCLSRSLLTVRTDWSFPNNYERNTSRLQRDCSLEDFFGISRQNGWAALLLANLRFKTKSPLGPPAVERIIHYCLYVYVQTIGIRRSLTLDPKQNLTLVSTCQFLMPSCWKPASLCPHGKGRRKL